MTAGRRSPTSTHGHRRAGRSTWSTSSTRTCTRRRRPPSARRRTGTAPTRRSPDANGNGGDYTGGGDKTVTLVDNVRDDNYYDFPAAPTYIAGFFSSQFNELLDRNVMTIDAFDWLHRTGANPPDEPTDDLCTSRPARPHLYEGTFAHEWQHLLQYYSDPFETTWINEGLSDFAQTLAGYVDATATVYDRAPTATSTASRASARCRRRTTPTRATAAGRRTRSTCGTRAATAQRGPRRLRQRVLVHAVPVRPLRRRLHLPRCTATATARASPSLTAAARRRTGVHDVYQVLHDYQIDEAARQARRRRRSGIVHGRAEEPGHHAEPALDGQPGQPGGLRHAGRGPERRRLRARCSDANGQAAQGQRPEVAAVPRARRPCRRSRCRGPSSTNDPDRPGNPVLSPATRTTLDAAAVTSVTVPTTDPTLTLPRQVRRGARLRLRLRHGVHRRRRDVHADRR